MRTARNISEFWTTFARTGRPSAQRQPAWTAYTTERRATMLIEAECRVVDDPFGLERQVWDLVQPERKQGEADGQASRNERPSSIQTSLRDSLIGKSRCVFVTAMSICTVW